MIDFEEAFRRRMQDASGAANVAWVIRPQADRLPAATLQQIGGREDQTHQGLDRVERATVQVDVWAKTPAEARNLRKALADAAREAGATLGVRFQRGFISGQRNGGENMTGVNGLIHRSGFDVRLTYSTEA